jgi:hypothetical protein
MRGCNYYIKLFYSTSFQRILANISNNISIVCELFVLISLGKSQWECNVWKKIENKVDYAHITFLKLNEFKQLIAQKKEHDPLSVLRLVSAVYVSWNSSYEDWVKENIENSWKIWM